MKFNKADTFISRAESMVQPESTALISTASSLFEKFPIKIQKKMFTNASRRNPYMGFIVDPYSFFLCYEIKNVNKAKKLVPDGYKIIPTKIFDNDEPKNYVIFGIFSVRTSAFSGSRIEMYIITENIETGMMTWVIVDYDTNTNSFDPARGFVSGNADKSVYTTTYEGNLLVDFESDNAIRKIKLKADIKNGKNRNLDYRLWLEGNLSVAYGKNLEDKNSVPFGLIFDPKEVKEAQQISHKDLNLEHLTWHNDLIADKPEQIVLFPYAQHFITTSIPQLSSIKNDKQLGIAMNDFSKIKTIKSMSSKSIKKSFLIGAICSMTISLSMMVWIILLYVLK